MEIYKTVAGFKFTENITDLGNLKNLEIRVKEVKTREICACSICHRIITIGETALKTAQKYHNRNDYYYQNFCDGCYLKTF